MAEVMVEVLQPVRFSFSIAQSYMQQIGMHSLQRCEQFRVQAQLNHEVRTGIDCQFGVQRFVGIVAELRRLIHFDEKISVPGERRLPEICLVNDIGTGDHSLERGRSLLFTFAFEIRNLSHRQTIGLQPFQVCLLELDPLLRDKRTLFILFILLK